MNSESLKELAAELLALTKKLSGLEQRKDVCIRGDMSYDVTPVERELEQVTRSIESRVEENPSLLTTEILVSIKAAYANSYPAFDSFRERTPAGGGDYTDIDSPIKSSMASLRNEIQWLRIRCDEEANGILDAIDREVLDWF